MGTDNNSLGTLSSNSSNDTRLSESVRESSDVHACSAAGGDDVSDLSEKPLGRFLAISRGVVSVVEVGKGRQGASKTCGAQFREKRLHGGLLGDGAREGC